MERVFECIPQASGTLNVFSHSGYDTYSASNEFIDNTFAESVKATFSKISVTVDENGRLKEIIFSDNGLSMDEKTAEGLFSFGKSPNGSLNDLGNYGAGAKSGGFSMGDLIIVYIKEKGKPWVKIWQDAKEVNETNSFIVHSVDEGDAKFTKDEIAFAEKVINYSECGTVFKISKLHDVTKILKNSFKESMMSNVRETYSRFITITGKKIFVMGKEVLPLSYTGGHNDKVGNFEGVLLDRGEIYLEGLEKHPIVWESYHLPRTIDISVKDYDIQVNSRTCGFFIFRNNRLVGSGVKCPDVLSGADHYLDGFRCLIYIDGYVDKHFGSTFNKMIKNGDGFSEELKEKLKCALSKSITESRKRRDEERVDLKTQDEVKRDMDITNMIQKLLENAHGTTAKAKQKLRYKFDENQKKELYARDLDKSKKRTLSREPGCDAFKKNILSVFGKFSISYAYSSRDPIYDIRTENTQYHMIVNANHPWYKLTLAGVNNHGLASWAISELGYLLAIDTVEDTRGKQKRLKCYEDLKENRDEYLRSISTALEADIYDDIEDEEYAIEKSDNCIGVGLTSEDFGITDTNKEMTFAMSET